jgi:hypothetical protein
MKQEQESFLKILIKKKLFCIYKNIQMSQWYAGVFFYLFLDSKK